MSSKQYYSNNTTGTKQTKYGKRKRSLESGSNIVITGSSNSSAGDKKFNSSIGKNLVQNSFKFYPRCYAYFYRSFH